MLLATAEAFALTSSALLPLGSIRDSGLGGPPWRILPVWPNVRSDSGMRETGVRLVVHCTCAQERTLCLEIAVLTRVGISGTHSWAQIQDDGESARAACARTWHSKYEFGLLTHALASACA